MQRYAEAAHKRGLVVLGMVYAAGDASRIAGEASQAALDGLVLEGQFAPDFSAALSKAAGSMLVIEIAKEATPVRWKAAPIVVIEGGSAERAQISLGNGHPRCPIQRAVDRIEYLARALVECRRAAASSMDQQPAG